MKLSPKQIQIFWREWGTTCRTMRWTRAAGMSTAAIDAKRKELLAKCGFQSLTDVDRTTGFTLVLNEVRVLRGTDLKAARETIDPTLNDARILLNQIVTDLIPCLEVYVKDIHAYAAEAFQYKDSTLRSFDLAHMNLGQLIQVRNTFNARLHAKRRQAGHSIHDMRMEAKLDCDCSACKQAALKAHYSVEAMEEAMSETGAAENAAADAWFEQEAMKEDEAFNEP